MNAAGFTLTAGEFREAIAGVHDLDRIEVAFGDDSVTNVACVEAHGSLVVLTVHDMSPIAGLADAVEDATSDLALTAGEIVHLRSDFLRAVAALEEACERAKATEDPAATKRTMDLVNAATNSVTAATKNLKTALTASERAAREIRKVFGAQKPESTREAAA